MSPYAQTEGRAIQRSSDQLTSHKQRWIALNMEGGLSINHEFEARAIVVVDYLMKRCQSMMTSLLQEASAPVGFTYLHCAIVFWLGEGVGIVQNDFRCLFRSNLGALNRVVATLETRGLLKKVSDRSDSLNVWLQLTAEGRGLRDRLAPIVGDMMGLAFTNFSNVELNELMRLLMKLDGQLQSLSGRELEECGAVSEAPF